MTWNLRANLTGIVDGDVPVWSDADQIFYPGAGGGGGGTPASSALGPWIVDDLAASQTGLALTLLDGVRELLPLWTGADLIGLVVLASEAITAGQASVQVTVNGSPVGTAAVLAAGQCVTAAFDSPVVLEACDVIGVEVTTDSSWAPTTADLTVVPVVCAPCSVDVPSETFVETFVRGGETPDSFMWIPPAGLTELADLLLVAAGGGAGGSASAIVSGGGGGGGVEESSAVAVSGPQMVAPGAGGEGGSNAQTIGQSGTDSIFGSNDARGGGAGSGGNLDARDGGSGGGSGAQNTARSPGAGTAGQGEAGGAGHVSATTTDRAGGGGGGADQAGAAGAATVAGDGGDGRDVSATFPGLGVSGVVSGGGGGGARTGGTAGAGGAGGGGTGGVEGVGGSAGTANSGGGGGGRGGANAGFAGADGLVAIRYTAANQGTIGDRLVGFERTETTTLTVTVNRPAGVTSGDLLIFAMVTRDATPDVAGPEGGGWTQAFDQLLGTNRHLTVWSRAATGSEAASYSFGLTDQGTQGAKAYVVALRGPSATIDDAASVGSVSVIAPTVNGTDGGALFCVWGSSAESNVDGRWQQGPPGMAVIDRFDTAGGAATKLAVAWKGLVATEATGTQEFATGIDQNVGAGSVAYAP